MRFPLTPDNARIASFALAQLDGHSQRFIADRPDRARQGGFSLLSANLARY